MDIDDLDGQLPEDGLPSATQLLAICQRAFGPQARIRSAQRMSGGTVNTLLRLSLESDAEVVLRIAPAQTAAIAWNDRLLMRCEQRMQPFFAPLAQLMPRLLLVDFTHQLIRRDYMLQTYLPGTCWEDVDGQLGTAERDLLWQQFGALTRSIHNVRGAAYGWPEPEASFASWSAALHHRFQQLISALEALGLETAALTTVLAALERGAPLLDAIAGPRLLHGDLWLYNLLVQREPGGPAISGLLDADRAHWGDPLADWTLFVLARASGPAMKRARAAFWAGYGEQAQDEAAQFRGWIYAALHAGSALDWATRTGDAHTQALAWAGIAESAQVLSQHAA